MSKYGASYEIRGKDTKYISILDEKDEKNAKKGIPLAEKYIGEEGNDVAARN